MTNLYKTFTFSQQLLERPENVEEEQAGGGSLPQPPLAASVLPGERELRRAGAQVVQGHQERTVGGQAHHHTRHQVVFFLFLSMFI